MIDQRIASERLSTIRYLITLCCGHNEMEHRSPAIIRQNHPATLIDRSHINGCGFSELNPRLIICYRKCHLICATLFGFKCISGTSFACLQLLIYIPFIANIRCNTIYCKLKCRRQYQFFSFYHTIIQIKVLKIERTTLHFIYLLVVIVVIIIQTTGNNSN